MLDGKWNMKVDTPIGKMDLFLDVTTEGNNVTGTCNFNKHDGDVSGTVDGDSFNIVTKLPTPFGKTKFKVNGTVDGDNISGKAKASVLGSFAFEGVRG